ncbi:AsmA-like C-terminal domain-containing protein [Desulfobacula sp.]|uniref:YhdP family protein n=1 Tax=Desulfobacula sp. TaxID=2593537 RepID=UPI002624E266|nr:AsmA-like C-terminal domain-containing protein [Desulfobacula sp.]
MKRPVFYGIFFSLILFLSILLFINPLVNTAYIKNRIASVVYEKTGIPIHASTFFLTVFPRASLMIDKVHFAYDKRTTITIDVLTVDMDIQALLRGRLHIRQITLDHPRIQSSILNKKHAPAPIDVSIFKDLSGVKKIFEFLPEDQTSVNLTVNHLISPFFKWMDGDFYLSKEEESRFHATLKGIKYQSSERSFADFDSYLDLDTIALDQLEIRATITPNNEIHGQCEGISPTLTSETNDILMDANRIKAVFNLSEKRYQIDIPPFAVNYPKGKIGIHFSNDRVHHQTKLQFTGTQIHIDEAREMSSAVFKDNAITQTLFEILPRGMVPTVTVFFQSRSLKDLFHGEHFKLEGTLEDGWVNIPKTDLAASQVSGEARIENGRLDITTSTAVIQNSDIKKGQLFVDLLNYDDHPFEGEFLLDIDLSMMPQTLISLLPGTLLSRELLRVNDVVGRATTQLNLSLAPGAHDLNVHVQTGDFSVTGFYDRIPGAISLDTITLGYTPATLQLSHVKGGINGARIDDLDAVIDMKEAPWITIQSGTGVLDLETIIPWLMSYKKTRDMLSPVKTASGNLQITSMDLSGPLLTSDLWTYDVIGTGLGINVTTVPDQRQMENLSCQYRLSEDFLSLKDIQMKISDLSWLHPLIDKKYLDSLLVPFYLENGHFQTNPNHCFFTSDLMFPAGPRLTIDLTGKTAASLRFDTIRFFDQDVSKGLITVSHDLEKPLFDFTGMLHTETINKIVMPASFWAKQMNAVTQGKPVRIYMDAAAHLNIITQQVSLNSLVSPSRRFPWEPRLLPAGRINFKADTLTIKDLTLTQIDSKVSLNKDQSHIRLDNAFLCDVKVTGDMNLEKDGMDATVAFEAHDNANIQTLLTCLLQKNAFMEGRYSLSGTLVSHGPKKKNAAPLGGSFTLTAEEGRIYKWTLLSRILSVLNFSTVFEGTLPDVTQQGFAYKKITIEADIKDHRIYLTKAIIDGQDMMLIFSGWIDPVKDEMDLTCLVAPFKTIDRIIEKIPIVSTLLGNRLISVPMKASGTLSDPVVIPLHPSAVGTGLINMMATILNTPVKLWDKLTGDGS